MLQNTSYLTRILVAELFISEICKPLSVFGHLFKMRQEALNLQHFSNLSS